MEPVSERSETNAQPLCQSAGGSRVHHRKTKPRGPNLSSAVARVIIVETSGRMTSNQGSRLSAHCLLVDSCAAELPLADADRPKMCFWAQFILGSGTVDIEHQQVRQ
jgi:hypothetical protein